MKTTKINENVLPANHSYQKDANAFMRGIETRATIIKTCQALRQPIVEKLGYKTETELWCADKKVHEQYNLEILMSDVKPELDKLGRKHMNLNKRLKKLKWGFWACYPGGTDRYYAVHPNNNIKK